MIDFGFVNDVSFSVPVEIVFLLFCLVFFVLLFKFLIGLNKKGGSGTFEDFSLGGAFD